jgi:hypothetical protein
MTPRQSILDKVDVDREDFDEVTKKLRKDSTLPRDLLEKVSGRVLSLRVKGWKLRKKQSMIRDSRLILNRLRSSIK